MFSLNKMSINKLNKSKNKSLKSHLKKQQKEKTELKRALFEKNKIILELEKQIQRRDAAIVKVYSDNNLLNLKNVKTMEDFMLVTSNVDLLQRRYDENCRLQQQWNDELKAQLQNQQSGQNLS